MTTSGTVSTTVFPTRKIIEHAYRRCKISPQEITPDRIEVALDLLYLRLSTLVNKGIALWAIQKIILPMYYGRQSVSLPLGAVDNLNANIRQLTRLTAGTASASEGDADNAFDEDIETACTQVTDAGYIRLDLLEAAQITSFGLLPNASGTWTYSIQGSNDGATWTTLYTATAEVEVAQEWQWWDVEGLGLYSSYRLVAAAGTILDVAEWVLGNNPQETNLAVINRDDYSNMPNKVFLSRPTQYWFNKQIDQAVVTLWPAPSAEYTFWQLVLYVQNYIQDVGTMRQTLQIPQSWYLAVVLRLAADIAPEDREVDVNLIPILAAEAEKEWSNAWDGQSDNAPSRLAPNISPYTR